MRTAAKVDKNQPEIVKALRKMGAIVLQTHQLKNAFDILVGFRGTLFMVEIKDGSLPPSGKKLSKGETQCKDNFESVGVKYWIIESVDDAVNMLNNG